MPRSAFRGPMPGSEQAPQPSWMRPLLESLKSTNKQEGQSRGGEPVHHAELGWPAKPVKLRARLPAIIRTRARARATPREIGQFGCLAFRRHEYEREGESATRDDDESQTLEKVVLAIGLEDREAEDCPVRGDQGELDSQLRKERQRKAVDYHRGQSDPGESNHRAIADATTGTALVQALRE